MARGTPKVSQIMHNGNRGRRSGGGVRRSLSGPPHKFPVPSNPVHHRRRSSRTWKSGSISALSNVLPPPSRGCKRNERTWKIPQLPVTARASWLQMLRWKQRKRILTHSTPAGPNSKRRRAVCQLLTGDDRSSIALDTPNLNTSFRKEVLLVIAPHTDGSQNIILGRDLAIVRPAIQVEK